MDAALAAGLTRPDYVGLLTDPGVVSGLPHVPVCPAIRVVDGSGVAPLPVPAGRDGEPLVAVAGDGLLAVPVYRVTGWPAAVDGMWLREGALVRLSTAVDRLPAGFGLAVLDGWRPLALQREIWTVEADAGTPAGFVSEPSEDPRFAPPHLTGGAVDVTLMWEGVPLALGTAFDCFSPAAAADAFEDRPGVVRDLRRLLHHVMGGVGFVGLGCEWWHFEVGTARWAARTGEAAWYGAAGGPEGR